jgi:hypothetical protein
MTIIIITIIKHHNSKHCQHPGYYIALFLKKTQTIIVSFYEYTVYIMFWIMMLYDCYYYYCHCLSKYHCINDTTGFYTYLQFDKAGFQKHLLTSSFRLWLVTNWLFLNKKISLSKIIILWYFCLFFATFHSFVIARYSDISIDRNDFDAFIGSHAFTLLKKSNKIFIEMF